MAKPVTRSKLWDHIEDIRGWAASGILDHVIAERLCVHRDTVTKFRLKLQIPSGISIAKATPDRELRILAPGQPPGRPDPESEWRRLLAGKRFA